MRGAVFVVAVVALVNAAPAWSADVTLSADHRVAQYDDLVRFRGTLSTPEPQQVTLVRNGVAVATTTGSAGRYIFEPRRGFVVHVEPRTIGRGIIALGGGRTKMDDRVDPSVGFVITARPGDWVEQGEPLATIFARDRAGVDTGRQVLRQAISIGDEADPPLPLVSHRVTSAGVEVVQQA